MLRYRCDNPKCEIYGMHYIGGAEDEACPICNDRQTVVVGVVDKD